MKEEIITLIGYLMIDEVAITTTKRSIKYMSVSFSLFPNTYFTTESSGSPFILGYLHI